MDNSGHEDKPTNGGPKGQGNHFEGKSEQTGISKEQKFKRYWNIIRQRLEAQKESQKNIEEYQHILRLSMKDQRVDRALGAIYGAMIGDALGAYCEFLHHIENQTVQEAMEMNGGGTFGLEAGQFTDDSELASHLLAGLSHFKEGTKLQSQKNQLICTIGMHYLKWMDSGPFDIGNTTRLGIGTIYDNQEVMRKGTEPSCTDHKFLTPIFKTIYNRNSNSKSNGSLMRISPMSFFLALTGQKPLEHLQFIKDQIRLTHSNQCLGVAGCCWVSLQTALINRRDNSKQTFKQILHKHINQPQFIQSKQIQSWFKEALKDKEEAMPGTVDMGFAKIAFSYGLRILNYLAEGKEKRLNEELYFDWMFWIIKRAGDTDTNGAIAGGLMGSIIGFWNLPVKYIVRTLKTVTDRKKLIIKDQQKQPVNSSKNKYQTPQRPNFYQPCNTLLCALRMVPKCLSYQKMFNPK